MSILENIIFKIKKKYRRSIGEHCWIGGGVKFLKGSYVPKNSVIGMNSVYTKASNLSAATLSGGRYLSGSLQK